MKLKNERLKDFEGLIDEIGKVTEEIIESLRKEESEEKILRLIEKN